jgi:MoaA/NifB/PqqE/SkfB family radical SAM enzyme
MMPLPLRLTAELMKARIAQSLRLGRSPRPVQFVDSAEILLSDSSHPISHEKIREITDNGSPAIWIGGSEPLLHPGIAHLVRAITQSGHFVFLETDGTALRRRIHEFQPESRLFLTVRMESGVPRSSGGVQAGASELTVEGIRAARLSGFSVCVCVHVTTETNLNETAELLNLAQSLDVDGIVISPAGDEANTSRQDVEAWIRKTEEARKMIGSKWWESFWRLVEPNISGSGHVARSSGETSLVLKQKSNANEEGVGVA